MRSKSQQVCLTIIRVILAPVALLGIFFIWLYVLLTLGFDPANRTISGILDL